MKKSRLFFVLTCIFGVSTIGVINHQKSSQTNLRDTALLALIKNDLSGLESFIKAGGDLDSSLPEFDGNNLTVAEGIAHFERVKFAHYLRSKKYPFIKQRPYGTDDVLRIAVRKNNPELLKEFLDEQADLGLSYKKNGWTLLHLASASCSDKLVPLLTDKKMIQWDLRAEDGSTPLTVAAENECLSILSYWKERGADFKARDGRGRSAIAILKQSKSPILTTFAASFEISRPKNLEIAQMAKTPNFYNKRSIPKDQIVDHSALLEPEDRPLEVVQTAEYSEFAD